HQIDEDESAPCLNADRIQREVFFADAVVFAEMRRSAQPAVKFVRPRMIRTADHIRERAGRCAMLARIELGPLVEHEAAAAMAAHVEVSGQRTVFRSNDEHALSSDVELQVITQPWNFFFPPRAKPLAPENALLLSPEDDGREIRVAGKRALKSHDRLAF